MKTDILVIGGGLAGRTCAQTASEKANVILLCDGLGASPYVHGLNIPLDERDSVECFMQDTLESGKYQNNKKLVEVLCQKSVSLADEFAFDQENGTYKLLRPLGATYPRVAGIQSNTGVHILNQINENKQFTELHGVRAMSLDVENQTIKGAYCFDTRQQKWVYIAAKAVVLAGGGFCGIFPFSTNSRDIGGDMIAMAYDAGAELCDLEFIQFEPTVAVYPKALIGKSVITTMLYEGAVFRNKHGKCFLSGNSQVNKDVLSNLIYDEIAKGNATEHGGIYFDATNVEEALMKKHYRPYYDRYRSVGIDITKEPMEIAPAPHTSLGGVKIDEHCRTNIAGLFACGEAAGGVHGANRLGGNAGLEVLVFGPIAAESAVEYTSSVPEVYDKNLSEVRDFGTGVAGGSGAVDGTGTLGSSDAVDGTGALGSSDVADGTGALGGSDAVDGSDALAGAGALNSSGALAGAGSLDSSGAAGCSSAIDGSSAADFSHIRQEIGQIVTRSLNVIRNEKDMTEALQQLSRILDDCRNHQGSYSKARAYNDALCAYLTLQAALERKRSIGCHRRSDSIDEPEKYTIVLQKHSGLIRRNVDL